MNIWSMNFRGKTIMLLFIKLITSFLRTLEVDEDDLASEYFDYEEYQLMRY